MICPNCHAHIADGLIECPVCSNQLGLTQKISLQKASWCPCCGALVAPGARVCSKCLSVVEVKGAEAPVERSIRKLDLPTIEDPESTHHVGEPSVPPIDAGLAPEAAPARDDAAIESAIPPTGPNAASASMRHDRMPKLRVLVFAGFMAILVVGGMTFAITHPWDPDASSTRATTPIDTSTAGSPGNVTALTGQDGVKAQSAEDSLFNTIESDYNRLGELANQVNNNEAALLSTGVSGDAAARAQGKSDASAISIEVSNLISSMSGLDDGAGSYTETLSNLTTLGNWLRNRCDALTSAWQLSVDSADPAADASSITYPVKSTYGGGTKSSYQTLFEENYEAWKPVKAS